MHQMNKGISLQAYFCQPCLSAVCQGPLKKYPPITGQQMAESRYMVMPSTVIAVYVLHMYVSCTHSLYMQILPLQPLICSDPMVLLTCTVTRSQMLATNHKCHDKQDCCQSPNAAS